MAARNASFGFYLFVTRYRVLQNVAQQNGGDGFHLGGSGHTVSQNWAFDNDLNGILLGATDSKLHKNTALGNGGNDLEDGNAACADNVWKKNIFGTSEVDGGGNPGCIQ